MSQDRLSQITAILLIVFVAFAGWQLRDWGVDTELEAYREQIEQFQANVEEVTQYGDSLQRENAQLLDALERNQEILDQAQAEADALENANKQISEHVDSLKEAAQAALDSVPPEVQEYVVALEDQVDSLEDELSVQKEINLVQGIDMRLYQDLYANEKLRADSLQATINAFPDEAVPDPEKLFGFIPLPSRKLSFLAGATTAVVGIVALTSG